MKPLDLMKRYKASKQDLIADCVLQTLHSFGDPVPTHVLLLRCMEDKVSSPATTYSKLSALKKLKMVKDYKHPNDDDTRKRWIRVSAVGALYLERWDQA
jgi:Fe2+ or Zn2+ uptake regulation protein